MKIRILLLLQILYLLFSCNGNNNLLEKALTFSGPNRNELEKVLRHYQNDDLKYKAAVFLIENMPTKYTIIGNELDSIRLVLASADNRGVVAEVLRNRWKGIMPNGEKVYDCRVITANYLINNIERSFDLWKSKEWNTSLSFIDFCELILPYRIGNEPLEEWWVPYKEKYGKILDSLYQGSDVIEAVNSFSKIALANLEALSESNEIKLRPFPVDENVTETKEVTSNSTWMIRKGTRRCPNSSSIEYTCKPGQFEDKTFIPFK